MAKIDQTKIGLVSTRLFFDKDGIRYEHGINGVLFKQSDEPSSSEVSAAKWLKKFFHEDVNFIPRINAPNYINSPDYWFKNDSWDYKELTGKINDILFNAIKKKPTQANNYFYDLTKSTLSLNDVMLSLDSLFSKNKTKNVINVIIKDGENFKIYQRIK